HRDAQQPRLPPGGHAPAAPVQPAQPRGEPRQDRGPDRHQHRHAEHRLRRSRTVTGLVGQGPDHRSEGPRAGAQGSRRGGQEGPAGAHRFRYPAALKVKHMRLVTTTRVRSLGLAALAAGLALGSSAALAADAAKGKENFMKYGCWQCHGTLGQGSPVTGPKLAPGPLPLDAMTAFIRNSKRQMPPYREEVLPQADLEDIHAYLASIPPAQDYKTIDLLNE